MRAWDYLMYQGYGAENVTVAGDSAGGNLALVLCRRLKAAGRRMPRALLLMSPWTDMTMSGASYRERVESGPMLTPSGGHTPGTGISMTRICRPCWGTWGAFRLP